MLFCFLGNYGSLQAQCDNYYVEVDGALMMEAEHLEPENAADGWNQEAQDPLKYIKWTGAECTGDPSACGGKNGLRTARFMISETGTYRFFMRSKQPDDNSLKDGNDVWVKIIDENNQCIKFDTRFDCTWISMAQKTPSDWTWDTQIGDEGSNPIRAAIQFFDPGFYKLQISGRSKEFCIDKFVLYEEVKFEDLQDKVGTFDMLTEMVERDQQPLATTDKTSICSEGQAMLNVLGCFQNDASFSWSPATGLDNASIRNPIATLTQTTEYTVTVTDNMGNTAKSSVTIEVFEDPKIDVLLLPPLSQMITEDSIIISIKDRKVELNVGISITDGLLLRWTQEELHQLTQINGGTNGTDEMISSVFQLNQNSDQGALVYKVEAENTACMSSRMIRIIFLLDVDLKVPNFFSPNNDGHNDEWQVESFTAGSISVFNAAGARVFYTTQKGIGWDGGRSPDGIYWFVVRDTRDGQAEKVYKGPIHLQRKSVR